MADTKQGEWDLEDVYDAEISPLMTRIIAICQQHRIPMVASFAYGRVENPPDTAFCTTAMDWPDRKVENITDAIAALTRGAPPTIAIVVATRKGTLQ